MWQWQVRQVLSSKNSHVPFCCANYLAALVSATEIDDSAGYIKIYFSLEMGLGLFFSGRLDTTDNVLTAGYQVLPLGSLKSERHDSLLV